MNRWFNLFLTTHIYELYYNIPSTTIKKHCPFDFLSDLREERTMLEKDLLLSQELKLEASPCVHTAVPANIK